MFSPVFWHQVPFFRLLLFLIAGIAAGSIWEINGWIVWAILGLGIGFLIASQTITPRLTDIKLRWLAGFGVFLCLFSIGVSRLQEVHRATVFPDLDKQSVFLAEIIDAPMEKAKSVLCRIELKERFDGLSSSVTTGKSVVYLQKDSNALNLKWGDELLISTTFRSPRNAGNPDEFDFKAYLHRQGFEATAYIPAGQWKKAGETNRFSLLRLANQCRAHLLQVFKENRIQGDEYAVLAALTLGYTDEISQELRADFAASGAMHILSVSGQHVAIIYVVFAFLLSLLDKVIRSEKPKQALLILFLWAYAFITGLSPSVVRSATMFSFVALGKMSDQKIPIYNSIFASAFLMLAYDPFNLFNVGFQLSYTALLGIVFFQPLIYKKLTFQTVLYDKPRFNNKALLWTVELISVSIAAQIGILPLSLYYFHQFTNYFLLTNLMVIPAATFIIYTAVALFVVSPISVVGAVVAFVLKWLVWVLNFSVGFIHRMPASLTENMYIDGWQLALLTVSIFTFGYFWLHRRFHILSILLCSLILIFSINTVAHVQTLSRSRLIVYAIDRSSAVHWIQGRESRIYTDNPDLAERAASMVVVKNRLSPPAYIVNEAQNRFMTLNGKRIVFLNDNFLKNKQTDKPLSVDYLILGNRTKVNVKELSACIEAKQWIIDCSYSNWEIARLKDDCQQLGLNYYCVAEQGAFVAEL